MRIAIRDHQNKSVGLVKAIRVHGEHEIVDVGEFADILLIDHDVTMFYKNIIERYHAAGSKIVLYPHGATAHLAWDGVWPVDSRVDAYLAQSEGQAEVMRRYGYPNPIYVTGWHWCEQKRFKNKQSERPSVLFAPIHPQNSGFIFSKVRNATRNALDYLYTLKGFDITVRHIGDIAQNKLSDYSGIKFVQGHTDNSIEDIDNADLVVSFGTFAYLAIARGIPTIMYRQDIPYFDGHSEESVKFAAHFYLYRDYIRYPYDVTDELDINWVMSQETGIKQWKKNFIGEIIDPAKLNEILEDILHA